MRKKLGQRAERVILPLLLIAGLGGCTVSRQAAEVPVTGSAQTPAVTRATEESEVIESTDDIEAEVEKALFQVPSFSPDRFPIVDGSTATLPLSIALYQQSTGVSEGEAQVATYHSTTDNSYYNMLYDQVDLLLVYEASQDVKDDLKEQGDPLLMKPIGKDALVFMMNQGNAVESLTERQIADIYSGDVKEWSQVGGMNRPIEAFQRPLESGSQTMMEKLVMKGRQMDQAPSVKVFDGMGDLIEGVAAYDNRENALGYSVYFYAKNMYEKPELKFLAVNGQMPSNASIKSGKYPFVNEFYAVIRKDEPENSPTRQLFDWLTTDNGQLFVEYMGYVGVNETINTTARKSDVGRMETVADGFQLPLKDNERIIMIEEAVKYNPTKLVMLDGNLNKESLPEGLTMSNRRIRKINLDEPQIMSEAGSDLEGIYSLKDRKWIVEPEYGFLYYDDEYDFYHCYRDDEDTNTYMDKEFNQLYTGNGRYMKDYIWEARREGQYDILSLEGDLVKSMDFTQNGEYYSSYDSFEYMVVDYKNRFEIYNSDGSLVFDKEDLPSEYQSEGLISLSGISGDRKCIEIYSETQGIGRGFLYSLSSRKLVPAGSDGGTLTWKGEEWYYETDDICYDTDGDQLFTASGHPAAFLTGEGWYGYEPEKGLCVLENENGSKTFTLKHELSSIEDVESLPGDYFILSDDKGSFVMYQEDQDVLRGSYIYTQSKDGYTIISYNENDDMRNEMIHLLLSREGELVYKTMAGEEIQAAGDGFVVTRRGSYLSLLDWDGNCGLSILDGDLGTD